MRIVPKPIIIFNSVSLRISNKKNKPKNQNSMQEIFNLSQTNQKVMKPTIQLITRHPTKRYQIR